MFSDGAPLFRGDMAHAAISKVGEKMGAEKCSVVISSLTFRETSLPGPHAGTV